ncbi:phosphate ABC transporter permease PstA [Testudinibacter sp. TR-2022]|uniref:phosphate ABC transporter permease PstA n=1 Tax=Testudinibacter sp. TR-2022 TaxID=2585029 RepID=UPI00111A8277|nr:phosphate ABC transporter permease PstA [Testudinibacter sp. TR-2022]TNH03504.1 phosphate ABC transporter permease PstA [Pasteurellaceae bacterium Phil31]TNH07924.1 phosphate ABC transporter permease PstA [Testudinibacter sp. TR-2022]TNH10339.1 phosphate ABC transporter permease PstA [Testudinibacter sp. TR-2022]TNH14507.1 phosphate ABC transporter permease PstA [Testudinibacter sp. TR-2022]TNH20825.1 phosphate ABC transporter permease PstA [Testudinibacter sp. TR-2022]
MGITNNQYEKVKVRLQNKRRIINNIAIGIAMLAMVFGLIWLVWILFTTLQKGMAGLSIATFLEMTPAPNAEVGGLANAIMGSLMMVVFATFIGTPLGILVGIYLSEYGKKSLLAEVMRFVNDILLSAPSIVIGLFVYVLLVAPFGNFSGWAGVVALALLQVPIVIRTTENMLNLIPNGLREAAYALGTPKWKMILSITLRASTAGVITGVLLSVARIAGETAPLMFTALSNQFWSLDMSKPMASLPMTIYKFASSPFTNWQELAWTGVLIITFAVLLLNVLARVVFKNREKK